MERLAGGRTIPYVSAEKKQKLDMGATPETAGELGYVVGKAMRDFLESRVNHDDDQQLRFQYICEVQGTLDTLARDFWDKVGRPYEAKVEAENNTFHWRSIW